MVDAADLALDAQQERSRMAKCDGGDAASAGSILICPYVRVVVTALACSLLLPVHSACAQGSKTSQEANTTAVSFAGYDVVSIKPNVSGSGSMHISARETTFQATNVSLKMMLLNAYGVRDAAILGLPKWAESTRWDINAKIVDPPPEGADKNLSREQSTERYRTRVQSILGDRFHLRAHKETRILPIYELVLLPGPLRFKRSEPSEEDHSGMNVNNRNMTATAIPLKSLAIFLSNRVDRTVEDRTSLNGTYDFALKWSADELAEAAKDAVVSDRPPEIHTALQEQLGLKLVSGKGPSEVLVVDSVEQPVLD